MSRNGQRPAAWAYAVEGSPPPMLEIALRSLRPLPRPLAECNGTPGNWVRDVAACLARGECRVAVLFCRDAELAGCVANKVPGVRAACVVTVAAAQRALRTLGANLLVVDMMERTYYECRAFLRLCQDQPAPCPPGLASLLQELDGHAHR